MSSVWKDTGSHHELRHNIPGNQGRVVCSEGDQKKQPNMEAREAKYRVLLGMAEMGMALKNSLTHF